ncbi:unnamed protein product [Mytilus coruscus]|uniref:Retrotransposon gag domain-containing protein n=1 Tax=Mytilus coruscus TaxID=42192 RepID=A0A6J8D2L7_MYTCO|nr:unnamed protein product [Mytilus coruscus]
MQEIPSARSTAKRNIYGPEYEVPEYQQHLDTTYQNQNKIKNQGNAALNYRDQIQTSQNYEHTNHNRYLEKVGYSNEAIYNKNYNPIQAGLINNTEFQTNKQKEYSPYLREQLNRRNQSPIKLSKLPNSRFISHKRKEKDPDTYNGMNVEWPDYICRFEQVAMWNEWTDQEKAAQLSICLRGNAQRVLSELIMSELSDYSKLKSALTQRFCPSEIETAFRCEFRTRRRNRDELAAEYGSAVTLISKENYDDLKCKKSKLIKVTSTLATADGEPLTVLGKTKLSNTLGSKMFTNYAIVVELRGMSGIFGLDFLSRNAFVIDTGKERLCCPLVEVQLFRDDSLDIRCARVH